MLGDWQHATRIILSCPGPLRRHASAILPARSLALPQVLLGSESQLLAFAAAFGPDRLSFAPFPEMFPSAAQFGADPVHLRFGSVRAARVLKGARNAVVLAERAVPPPLTASHHPFASGKVLPAAIERVFTLGEGIVRPTALGGAVLASLALPWNMLDADLKAWDGPEQPGALEITSLAAFDSDAWARGGVHAGPKAPCPAGCVLLPWNMDHPGSIVPDLLDRLVSLTGPDATLPRIVLLPFNYIGQTGIIRALIERIGEAAQPQGSIPGELFIARLAGLGALPALKALASVAWVDGNDPESAWTAGRLAACGFVALPIEPADEALWIEAETRCGTLAFNARLPSLGGLRALLATTAGQFQAPKRRRAAR